MDNAYQGNEEHNNMTHDKILKLIQALKAEQAKSVKLAEALTQTKCLVADTRTIRKKCVCARCVALKEYKGEIKC